MFLNSSSNEENTNANIEDLGYNLANELNNFISSNYESIEGLSKISFIGHSLGGVIIRTAIQYLEEAVKKKFFTLMTFSSPHLGYM